MANNATKQAAKKAAAKQAKAVPEPSPGVLSSPDVNLELPAADRQAAPEAQLLHPISPSEGESPAVSEGDGAEIPPHNTIAEGEPPGATMLPEDIDGEELKREVEAWIEAELTPIERAAEQIAEASTYQTAHGVPGTDHTPPRYVLPEPPELR